jgi:nucleoid-associated protein YgaU
VSEARDLDPGPDPNQADEQEDKQPFSAEYIKFGVLTAVLLAAVALVALLGPNLFQNVLPSALGLSAHEVSNTASVSKQLLPSMQQAEEEEMSGLESAAATHEVAHTVQPGETLYRIAVDYGLEVEDLAAANRIVNPYHVEAGAVLIIPQP